jgi:hypothetical protein
MLRPEEPAVFNFADIVITLKGSYLSDGLYLTE